jgi:hypothetical protein
MRLRTALTAGVVTVLLTAGCLGPAGPATTGGDDADATIDVGATAEGTAPPDLARVRVAVVSTAPSPDRARTRTAENVSRMRGALRSLGVEDDRVRTTYFDLGPVYGSTDGARSVVGYRAAHGFAVEADVDRAGAVVDTAVASGATEVDGVTFTLAPETRRSVRARALERAMTHARRDAEALASAGNVSISGVRAVSTSDGDVVPYEERLAGGSDSAATVVEPGPVTVSVRVAVTYSAAG